MAPRHQTIVICIRPQRAQKTINHNPGLEILTLIVPPHKPQNQKSRRNLREKSMGMRSISWESFTAGYLHTSNNRPTASEYLCIRK
jgi:hypothetical protein